MRLTFLDFLDSREKAILLWTVALAAFVAFKGDGLGSSLAWVLRSVFLSKLVLLFGLAALYCAALVWIASKLGLWHTTALKATLYWFFGVGLLLTGNATQASNAEAVRRLARQAITVTLIVEFLVSLYVFPLLVELLIVPLVAMLVGVQVVAEKQPSMASAKKLADRVLVAFGLGIAVYVCVSAISDLDGLLTRANAEDFLVAPALTLAFLPYLYAVAWLSRRELEDLRRRYLPVEPRAARLKSG